MICSKAAAGFFERKSSRAPFFNLTDALVAVVRIRLHPIAFLLTSFKVVIRAACTVFFVEHIRIFTLFRFPFTILTPAAGKWIPP